MDHTTIEGTDIAYELLGSGPPVALIHAGICADWFVPLLNQPALVEQFRVLSYHRPGYGQSGRATGQASIAEQAEYLRLLMLHTGIEQAHIVGHSNGGMIALQLALDAPEMVASLALLESARPADPNLPEEQAFVRNVVARALQHQAGGDRAGAVDVWMRGVCGPDYRAALEQALPEGAFHRAIADADTFFILELPTVRAWAFTREDAARVTQPALAVLGERSKEVTPTFDLRHHLLLNWLPRVEPYVLPGATHLLHVQNPRDMAERLAAFFTQHPIPEA